MVYSGVLEREVVTGDKAVDTWNEGVSSQCRRR